jgi:hypothetical protein
MAQSHFSREKDYLAYNSIVSEPSCAPGSLDSPRVPSGRGVGSRDSELLAPEFRPMDSGALADREPFTAWLRRGSGRDRIFAAPQLYEPHGTSDLIREQSRQRFGRSRGVVQRQRRIPL